MCHRYGLDVGSCIRPKYPFASDGERNFKLTSPRLDMQQNATLFNNPPLLIPTLYASPLITLTHKGYTKHYFEEGRRVCSKLGGGFPGRVPAKEIDKRVPELAYGYDRQFHHQRYGVGETFGNCIAARSELIDRYDLRMMLRDYRGDERLFFYHNDHLGSAAYITDESSQVTQTLNYLPYGEDWVEVRNDFDPRIGHYTFNGKEKDYESGFHYYGARYYWSELLTGWLSVDALTDSMPNITPYAYCFNNPVKLVEPDGNFPIETIWDIANLAYDFGAAVVNHARGNHSRAASHWADAAMDAVAVAIPFVPAGASKVVRGTNSAVKSFNASNLKYIKSSNGKWSPTKYRQNLQKYTGKEGAGCHAHHTLPKNQELSKYFEAVGLDVNDPANMVWRKGPEHTQQSQKHLAAWRNFFENNPNATKEQILKFRDNIEKKLWGNTTGDI